VSTIAPIPKISATGATISLIFVLMIDSSRNYKNSLCVVGEIRALPIDGDAF
jgi:hypothetical protein